MGIKCSSASGLYSRQESLEFSLEGDFNILIEFVIPMKLVRLIKCV